MDEYPIQAEIANETWYIKVHADSPEHAIEEGKWKLKRIANVPINHVQNTRIVSIDHEGVSHD